MKNTEGKDVKVAECWLRINIVNKAVSDLNVSVDPVVIEYSEFPADGKVLALSWEKANKEILGKLGEDGMSYNGFRAFYDVENASGKMKVTYYDEDGEELETVPEGVTADISGLSDNNATNAVELTITNQVDENLSGSVKGQFNGTKWEFSSSLKEHFEDYLDNCALENHGPIHFILKPLVNGVPVEVGKAWPEGAEIQTGAEITPSGDGGTYKDQVIKLTEPLVGDKSKTYIVTAYTYLSNGHVCQMNYNVQFVNPFVVELPAIELMDYPTDTEDVAEMIAVADGKNVLYAYDETAEGMMYSEYAEKNYGLDGVSNKFDFEYGLCFYDEETHPDYDKEAAFGGNLTNDGSEYTWKNLGTDLRSALNAGYSVTATLAGVCESEGVADITIVPVD